MWLHFLSWKRKLFQSELQINIWYSANLKEEYVNFYRNSVQTGLFSLFSQGKMKKKKNHLTEGISQAEFLKRTSQTKQAFSFMTVQQSSAN